jgi:hypothetical protein
MQNYKVNILLSDGDEIQSRVLAKNQEHALERLQGTQQFIDFLGDREIQKVEIKPEKEAPSVQDDNYLLQKSEKPNRYVVTDVANNCTIIFEERRFNETQKIEFLDKNVLNPVEAASILRMIGEWLARNHSRIAFGE